MTRRREATAAVAIVAAVWLLAWWQQRVSLGIGDDGQAYFSLAGQVAEGAWPLQGPFPFVARVGVPLVVGALRRVTGASLLQVFYAVNTLFAWAALLLWWRWSRAVIQRASVRLAVLALWAGHWAGPLRYVQWYPTITDQALVFVFVLALYTKRPLAWLALLCGATLVREAGSVLAAGAVGRRLAPLCAAAVGVAAGLTLTGLVTGTGPAQILVTTRHYQATIGYHYPGWKSHALAWWLAFGPALFLPFGAPYAVVRLWRSRPQLLLLLVACTPLWWYEPVDHQRLVLVTAPFVYPVIGVALEELALWRHSAWELLVGGTAAQSLVSRWWWAIPACCPDVQYGVFGHACHAARRVSVRFLLTTWTGHCTDSTDLTAVYTTDALRAIMLRQAGFVGAAAGLSLLAYWLRRWRKTMLNSAPTA